jgi:5-methylcytosine-specific restriction protein B
MAEAARGNPDEAHVLIIDEINRAHLGRVLGEVMMLVEAGKRDDTWGVRLAYQDTLRTDGSGRFHLPPNLYFIGTMNAADRSLAVVDYALRRHFAFL